MKRSIINEFSCTNVSRFLDLLTPWNVSAFPPGCIFRGHADAEYKLLPSALRLENEAKIYEMAPVKIGMSGKGRLEFEQAYLEYGLIREFYRLADARGLSVPISDFLRSQLFQSKDMLTLLNWTDNEKWLPDSLVEAAALAQHYGVPTRLLDWTYDPFVAAFFASYTQPSGAEKLCVWAMDVERTEFHSSLFGADSNLRVIHPPYAGNPNLAAQRGVFTHFANPLRDARQTSYDVQNGAEIYVDRTTLDEYVDSRMSDDLKSGVRVFTKITLPASMSAQLRATLKRFGYSPSRMFPGYGGVAEEMLGKERR